MENNNIQARSVFSSMWVRILIGIVGLALISIGVYRFLGGTKSAKISGTTVTKFNEINSLFGEVRADLKLAGDLLVGIAVKEQAKDYSGIINDLNASTAKFDETASKIGELNSKIAEFKSTIDVSSDPAVKESASRVINLWGNRNDITLKLIDDEKKVLEPAKKYYEGLKTGKKVPFMTDTQLNTITQSISGYKDSLNTLSGKIDTAIQDFVKAAGLELKSPQK